MQALKSPILLRKKVPHKLLHSKSNIFRYIEDEEHDVQSKYMKVLLYVIHGLQCGVLWRYAKLLFLPMGSAIPLVKREMRNLCILRMVHGFLQV